MKKALNIIKSVLVWMLVAVSVFMMIFTIVSVTTFNRNDRDLFGYRAYTVLSDSMKDTFPAGSIVFMKSVDPNTLKEGDVISYISQSTESFGEIITHKIRSKAVDAEGNPGFITYGTTTGVDDEIIVTFPYITGLYQGHIPGVGYFFNFLKTPQGYFVCIFIPFAMLIIVQGVKCIKLFRRYKNEQNAELQAERDQIEAERAENARMLAELKALQEQLTANNKPTAPPDMQTLTAEGEKTEDKPEPAEESKEEEKPEQAPVEEVKEEEKEEDAPKS